MISGAVPACEKAAPQSRLLSQGRDTLPTVTVCSERQAPEPESPARHERETFCGRHVRKLQPGSSLAANHREDDPRKQVLGSEGSRVGLGRSDGRETPDPDSCLLTRCLGPLLPSCFYL